MVRRKKEKRKKRISWLDYACVIGEKVQWKNVKGDKFEGKLIKMSEDYIATVLLDNGSEVEVQC